MEELYRTARPANNLTPWVGRYVGYRLTGFPSGVHLGLPSRHLTFIVSIGSPIRVLRQCDRQQAPDSYRTVLGGLQASAALIGHDGDQEGVAIELTPPGFHALFDMPASELWNLSLELEDVDPLRAELWERLQGTVDWPERFRICDEVLGHHVRCPEATSTVDVAWKLLAASAGTTRIGVLADEVGWSRQNLTRRFHREFGLGPKLAASVIRFERAQRMLDSSSSISRIASCCGYFDQAHMNRDFIRLSGLPPAQLVAGRDVPIFQDEPGPDVGR